MEISNLVQGCMTWGKWGANFSKEAYQQQIEASLAMGVTTFDHADIYGGYTTEAEFGTAIKDMQLDRAHYQLVSKCGIQMENFRSNKVKHYQYDEAYILKSVEQSLKHLQTDYLDLFLLHRPSPLLSVDEVSIAVQKLLDQGKIKSFGVSNFTVSQMTLLQQRLPVQYNQIQLSLTHSESLENGVLDFLQLHAIRPMAWSPLGNYFKKPGNTLAKTVREVALKYDATEAQIVLAWLYAHPSKIIPVVGTTHVERLKQAHQASQIELDLQDWFALWEAARGHQVA